MLNNLTEKMTDNCSTETMLAKLVSPCAGGEKEAAVTAYKTWESYLLMRESRERHDILATEKS